MSEAKSGAQSIDSMALNPAWYRSRNVLISHAALLGLVIFVVWASRLYVAHTPIDLDQSGRLKECRTEILQTLRPQSIDLQLLGEIHGLCYARVDEEDILQEFGVRRAAYLNQQYQVPIMLWMVVIITLSGVALAGLQLLAGYRLAALGREGLTSSGQLTIEPRKISVHSTVTGVLILAISLAFFYVFVKEVYLIKELKVPPTTSEAGNVDLHAGWGQSAVPRQIPVGNLSANSSIRDPIVGPYLGTNRLTSKADQAIEGQSRALLGVSGTSK